MAFGAYHLNSEYISQLRARMEGMNKGSASDERNDSLLDDTGALPSNEQLATIIDEAFWASYSRDEGNDVTVSIIFAEARSSFDTFHFDQPIPCDVKNLVKLGAALENPQADIGVWPDEEGNLQLWGFKTRSDDTLITALWIQALGPGQVLITFGGKSLGALIGNEAVFIDHSNLMRAVMPRLLLSDEEGADKILKMIRYTSLLTTARAMRGHGRGGTLLVVPDSVGWRRSVDMPVPYTGGASFLESDYDVSQKPSLLAPITDFFSGLVKKKQSQQNLQSERFKKIKAQVDQQCRHIARLTAVDGALVMTYDRFVFCFGAKINTAEGQDVPTSLKLLRPVEGDKGEQISLVDIGGTRHQSAAIFAHAQPGAVAIVASQDGGVTFFCADPENGELLAIQQAELAVMHEGLGAAYWNYYRVAEMELFEAGKQRHVEGEND